MRRLQRIGCLRLRLRLRVHGPLCALRCAAAQAQTRVHQLLRQQAAGLARAGVPCVIFYLDPLCLACRHQPVTLFATFWWQALQ